jgi:hypothetical protein
LTNGTLEWSPNEPGRNSSPQRIPLLSQRAKYQLLRSTGPKIRAKQFVKPFLSPQKDVMLNQLDELGASTHPYSPDLQIITEITAKE